MSSRDDGAVPGAVEWIVFLRIQLDRASLIQNANGSLESCLAAVDQPRHEEKRSDSDQRLAGAGNVGLKPAFVELLVKQ